MTLHDYTVPRWGHNCTIVQIKDDGKRLRVCLWDRVPVEDGDHLIVRGKDRAGETMTSRYRVDGEVERPANPGDQYFCWAVFDPRPEREDG